MSTSIFSWQLWLLHTTSVTLLRLRGLRDSFAILATLKILIDIDIDMRHPANAVRRVKPTMLSPSTIDVSPTQSELRVRVSRVSRVTVWIRVSVRLRVRYSFSGAKL